MKNMTGICIGNSIFKFTEYEAVPDKVDAMGEPIITSSLCVFSTFWTGVLKTCFMSSVLYFSSGGLPTTEFYPSQEACKDPEVILFDKCVQKKA